jgi:hypothetical protein
VLARLGRGEGEEIGVGDVGDVGELVGPATLGISMRKASL